MLLRHSISLLTDLATDRKLWQQHRHKIYSRFACPLASLLDKNEDATLVIVQCIFSIFTLHKLESTDLLSKWLVLMCIFDTIVESSLNHPLKKSGK